MSTICHIAQFGVATSIGVNAPQNAAALRGGLTGYRLERSLPARTDGRPHQVARLPFADFGDTAVQRMRALAKAVIAECTAAAGLAGVTIPILISVPAQRPGWATPDAMRFVSEVFDEISVTACPDRSRLIQTGHAGGLAMIGAGLDMITTGEAAMVLVVGVQSFDIDTLDWMEGDARLKGPSVSHGTVPGEGAAAILLVNEAQRAGMNLPARLVIEDVQVEEEETPWFSGKPVTGGGLSRLMKELLITRDHHADITVADHTGEVWRAEEWSVAYLRTGDRHGHPLVLHHPASQWGDTGAAAGPLLTFAAAEYLGQAKGARSALVVCSSDQSADRSGLLIVRAEAVGRNAERKSA